jgi:hypothetical protein
MGMLLRRNRSIIEEVKPEQKPEPKAAPKKSVKKKAD